MERVYINRDWCKAYIVIALHNIYHSANKERTIEEVIEEIKEVTEIYVDETEIIKVMNNILKEEGKLKISFCKKEERIGITIEECADYLGVSKQLVAELVKLPNFPCVKFKRRILINKHKISDWLDENRGKFIKY